ncbi:MAG: DUF58 domain-containing protein [Bdellovibrionota bacterium]|jgi:uncharacterized protein (DUF58 family)
MIPKDLAKKIRAIEIYTTKAADDVLAGAYESVFKGRGMEFDEVREYTPGDDVRSIDWNVTARVGRPYIKRYVEERELTVMLLVDLSASGSFGTARQTKNETAAELCALLSFSAIKNNDKVGLLAFTDEVELNIPPSKGTTHVLKIIQNILHFTPKYRRTNIQAALEYLAHIIHKRCVIFLISDFQDHGYEKLLRILAKKHDIIACQIIDQAERELSDLGLLHLEDAETGESAIVDTSSEKWSLEFSKKAAAQQGELDAFFKRESIDLLKILNGSDYIKELLTFFRKRKGRLAA